LQLVIRNLQSEAGLHDPDCYFANYQLPITNYWEADPHEGRISADLKTGVCVPNGRTAGGHSNAWLAGAGGRNDAGRRRSDCHRAKITPDFAGHWRGTDSQA
jgi:hypothetical protein